MADTDKLAAEMLDRFERAAMAYERLGKLTKDDEKTRDLRRVAIAELAEARRALLEERSAREAALAAANDIDVKTVVQELNVEDHREYNRIITALEAENKRLADTIQSVLTWADQRCPCHNEQPNPCPLCGASVENLEACKSAENTFPRRLLSEIRDTLRRARDLSRNRRETP